MAMSTPERIAKILDEDERLTPETRAALTDLFAAAYDQLAKKDLTTDETESIN
jgi:hypothetical protein